MTYSLYLYKDETYSILMVRDHWRAIEIQLLRYGPKRVSTSSGKILEERAPYLVKKWEISTYDNVNQKVPADLFKREVSTKITAAKVEMAKLMELDTLMDGTFADYTYQAKQYNLPERASEPDGSGGEGGQG